MSTLQSELNSLCAEIRSEKITTRNKAAERLDNILSNTKASIISLVDSGASTVSWADIFNSAIQAVLKHAIKIVESQDSKAFTTLRNKIYLYSAIVTKLVDYDLEDRHNFLSKSDLLSAFFDGFATESAVKFFGSVFLYVLDTGIYTCEEKVMQLKVDDFSRILSYLFQTYILQDQILTSAVLRSVNKTIELATLRVQLNADLIEYFPKIQTYANCANDDKHKAEVIKLFYLFVSQLFIDYHNCVCINVQEVLPVLCGFYNFRMKTEAKQNFFNSVLITMTSIYPHAKNKNYKGSNVNISNNQRKTLKKLESIIENEIKERQTQLYRSSDTASEKCLEVFVQMSAFVVYLVNWYYHTSPGCRNDNGESRKKVQKIADKLESIIDFVIPQPSSFNDIWLAILAELLHGYDDLININNYQQILQTTYQILCMFKKASHLTSLRICFSSLIRHEDLLVQSDSMQKAHCSNLWAKIVEFLLSETYTDNDIIKEKQLILQTLIYYKKLTLGDINVLLQTFLATKTMRRTECIATVCQILKHANRLGLSKTSELISCIIKWLNESTGPIDAKSALLNIDPIDMNSIVDCGAIAVINFLNESATFANTDVSLKSQDLMLLLYKYNHKYVCIEEHGNDRKQIDSIRSEQLLSATKNCLFQNNYELLMRLLNFQTTKGTSPNDICVDLSHLQFLTSLMKRFIEYRVFAEDDLCQCPLIKRIGFFLSHLEFQLKNSDPQDIDSSDLQDILQRTEGCLLTFSSDKILLNYLESQPLEELINFLGKTLKFAASQNVCYEIDDWSSIERLCLKILASLCASASHSNDTFALIGIHKFNSIDDVNVLLILIKTFSTQRNKNSKISVWFVNKLKMICQMHHNNVEISATIVKMLPEIFKYVEDQDSCLEDMLIILSSFIKKAHKKSCSTFVVVNLMKTVRLIVKNSKRICNRTDFTNVCATIAKFISHPSLEVQLAAVNTITGMMDFNWFSSATEAPKIHAKFCKNLFSKIDYKTLPTKTADDSLNSISVATQLLVAVFLFSSCNQDIALQELVCLCDAKKLDESNFHNFPQVSAYFHCTLAELTNPYVPNVMHFWCENEYPISRFPYFLFGNSREEFELKHISLLTCCILTHSDIDELKILEKYKQNSEISTPTLIALALPLFSGCANLVSSNYGSYVKRLINNLNLLGVDLRSKTVGSAINWRIIYGVMELLNDENDFGNMFGFAFCFHERTWFNINLDCLVKCLLFYIENCEGGMEASDQPLLSPLITKHPNVLVQVLNALKEETCAALFHIDKIKSFHLFCVFAKLVIDAVATDVISNSTIKNCKKYFVRDILFYALYILEESPGTLKLQPASLCFIQKLLSFPVILNGLYSDILKSNLNYIIRSLVLSAKKSVCSVVRESAVQVIRTIIEANKDKVADVTALVDELPKTEVFDELRNILFFSLSEKEEDFTGVINNLLEIQSWGTECLKSATKHIARNKARLQQESTLIQKFMRRLLEIIRNQKNHTFALEAAKCLGEIGSLRLTGFSYYFETDVSFYSFRSISEEPMYYFAKCILKVVDNLLSNYNKDTYSTSCNVCQQLVSSRHGCDLLNLFPYLNVFHVGSDKSSLFDGCSTTKPIDLITVLKDVPTNSYDLWIRSFVAKLYSHFEWRSFEELCCSEVFAESSLIPIFKLLLSKKHLHLENILAMLQYFFQAAFDAIECRTNNLDSIYREKRVIKHFLDICECVRIYNEWKLPNINLLYVAKACNYCQAYFMSVLYLELFSLHEAEHTDAEKRSDNITNELFQEVSIKAYQSIGCYDAIPSFLNPLSNRLDFLSTEASWSDVLLLADATDSLGDPTFVDSMKRNGLFSLVSREAKSSDYELCWRLCQWDTEVEGCSSVNSLNDMENEFQKHHFNSLKCIFNREELNSTASITNARKCVALILEEISVECVQSIYKYVTWLQLLQQAEDFCQLQFASPKSTFIFQKWITESELDYGQFWCKEMLLSHQVTLFRTAGTRASRKIKEFFKDNDPVELCLLKSIKDCKKAGEVNFAVRNIAALKSTQLSNVQAKASVLLEDAEISFTMGKSDITKAILKHLIDNKDYALCPQRVNAYRMYGEYLMESNTETFETVLHEFFNSSINLLETFAKNKDRISLQGQKVWDLESFDEFERKNRKHAYEVIAKYADREYSQLNTYIKSDEFEMKCKIIQENRQAAAAIGQQSKDRDKNIGALFMRNFANLDEKEVSTIKQKRTEYLCIAVENYIKFSRSDPAVRSPAIYRILALWFANKHDETLHSKISDAVNQIPSYKFLCVLNQMTARLNSRSSDFLSLLKDILVKCAVDHPHHTLFQLFALVHAYTDSTSSSSNERATIAKTIINKARDKSNNLCIKQLETMFPALIEFANDTIPKSNKHNALLSDKLKRMRNLDAVQCPTIELPISTNTIYNITSIIKWDDKVSLVGGINAPKKLTCLCSDGIRRAQLLKGKDDLRQDAVMQQVFSLINDLLSNEPETSQRKLKLRTYKVVPLSMRSGIIEWCENAIPIGAYLIGDGKEGAHKKYRPQDYSAQKCRSLLMQHLKSDKEKRFRVYQQICCHIQPVFHYFFLEKYLVPGEWFERRLAYTNSVATNSIVGFILGIGDRHTQNILIDEKTAEVVHIDFGIAFDQGKIMQTPETVPFRLTRDIVAAMGACGTNGVFKKSCEATMRVLRRNQASIITILEVLLHDPLYLWKVVPQAGNDNKSEVTNLTAHRALLCVQNKLEGKQTGIFGSSGVEVQVNRLINEAVLNKNLCLLYPGWDPYL